MDVKTMGKAKQAMPRKDTKASKKSNKLGNFELLSPKSGLKGKKLRPKGKGVIYIGRIPHGFYEDQMTAYFSQFGRVVSAVVSRSKKSGRSKGYGFVEFEDEEVAKIAAETMNNYLMYNKIIQCRYIPPAERKKHKLHGNNPVVPCARVLNRIKDARNKRKSFLKLNQSTYQLKTQKKIAQFKRFFEERGIKFNFKINSDNVNDSDPNDTETEKHEMKHSNDAMDEANDQFGVLEIDPSDAEIQFRIPPQVKKIIKKSSNSSLSSGNNISLALKEPKQKKSNKSTLKEGRQVMKQKEPAKRANRNTEENSHGKVFKTEKNKLLTRKSQTLLSQKKTKMKKAVDDDKKLKKDKNKVKQTSKKVQSRKHAKGILAGEKNK